MIQFHGAWPALVTPFTTDNTINVAVVGDLIDYHLAKQVNGFYVCGRTGQGLSLSAEERRLMAETVVQHVRQRVPVIVHVGGMSVQESVLLARHAAQIGAAGLSSIIPPYYTEMEPIIGFFRAVAQAAPDLPFFPYLFGFPKVIELMQNLLAIPNVKGTKYTGPDMHEFQQVANLRQDDWYVLSGMDEQCLFARMSGAAGCIGSTMNIMPGVYRKMYACVAKGNLTEAMEWQNKANAITETLYNYTFMSGLTEALRLLGFDAGAVRLPLSPLPAEQRDALKADLEAVGFFELAAM